jgi:hypothetical protein
MRNTPEGLLDAIHVFGKRAWFYTLFLNEQTPCSPLFVASTTNAFDCGIHVNIQFVNDAEQQPRTSTQQATKLATFCGVAMCVTRVQIKTSEFSSVIVLGTFFLIQFFNRRYLSF